MTEPFHIMAKPVCGLCNLACEYCYYRNKPGELYGKQDGLMMSDATLETYTNQYLQAMPQRCEFGWQGGEPLLAGLDFFRRAVELQKSLRRPGQIVTNAIQTNATLLDEQWCEFLAGNEFLAGISLDGPPQLHDFYRLDHAGQPSFHRAWAGLEMVKKHGGQYNVLVTLNSNNAPHGADLYRYFVNRGVQYLQFIPVLERSADGQVHPSSCSPQQLERFLLEVFEQWAARDVGAVSERFMDNALHQILYGNSAMCCYAGRCANAMVLEHNGDLYACDHFVFAQWRVGNIHQTPLEQMFKSDLMAEFARLKATPDHCRDCEYLAFCNAGCPKHHVPVGTDPGRGNYYCQAYIRFFRQALPELRRIAEYIRAGQRPVLNPEIGPERRQGQIQQRPASPKTRQPGRNDPCPCGSGKKFKNCCAGRIG